MNYLTASNRKYLPPSIDKHSLFRWIPTIFKINDDEIIQYAGLDAYVFLGFFKMSIKLLTFCLLFSAAVISPVRYYFTGNYDDDNPNSGDHYNGTAIISESYFDVLRKKKSKNDWNIGIDMERPYLGLYVIFAFVFTYATIYFLFDHANKVIKKRQEILGNQCSVTDRTIKIKGMSVLLEIQLTAWVLERQIKLSFARNGNRLIGFTGNGGMLWRSLKLHGLSTWETLSQHILSM